MGFSSYMPGMGGVNNIPGSNGNAVPSMWGQPQGVPGNQNPTGNMGGGSTGTGVPMMQQTAQGQTAPAQGWNFGMPSQGQVGTAMGQIGSILGNAGSHNYGGAPPAHPQGAGGIQLPQQGQVNNGVMPGGQAGAPTQMPGVGSTGTTMPGVTSSDQSRILGENQNYYGQGIGSYITSLMQNGGMNMGLVNQVNSADLGAMQGNIQSGAANLNSSLGAQGVSGNSSTSALANSNYQNQATSQENAQVSQNMMQEYNIGQQLEGTILPGIFGQNAAGTANQPNWMDYTGMAAGIGGALMGL